MFQYFESKISKKPNGIKSLRNLLMWKVAFYSALRVGELVQIKMSDIQEYEG